MNIESISDLIMRGEGDELELKINLRDSGLLARLISSFANTKGGKIIIGVKENGELVGVNTSIIKRIFDSALKKISPIPKTSLEFIQSDNKDFAVIQIEKSISPIIAEGGFYIRKDTLTHPISPEDISFAIKSFPKKLDNEDLYKAIAKQTEIIEKLREELKENNSIRSKLKDYLLGGIIGAIIGLLLSLLWKTT